MHTAATRAFLVLLLLYYGSKLLDLTHCGEPLLLIETNGELSADKNPELKTQKEISNLPRSAIWDILRYEAAQPP